MIQITPSIAAEVDRAEGLMARELRPFLLAPAYVTVMAGGENLLYGDPRLVRKHLLFATLDRADRAGCSGTARRAERRRWGRSGEPPPPGRRCRPLRGSVGLGKDPADLHDHVGR